ncbi:hypothetical protein [Flavobacterium sp. MMS24-S5]|uniref:hypothetical protein n=1 Tax=Flavobacterium sp. MMS24-S5 TaxID=3416605 RepID=UPI003CFE1085
MVQISDKSIKPYNRIGNTKTFGIEKFAFFDLTKETSKKTIQVKLPIECFNGRAINITAKRKMSNVLFCHNSSILLKTFFK